jgi:hypothetical protein
MIADKIEVAANVITCGKSTFIQSILNTAGPESSQSPTLCCTLSARSLTSSN